MNWRSNVMVRALARTVILARPLAIVCVLQGCNTGVTLIQPGEPTQALAIGSSKLPTGNLDYRVTAMDTLQVEVFPGAVRSTRIDVGSQVRIEAAFTSGAYAVSTGDTLSIEINADTDTTSQVVVRPDGSITLPHIAKDISAAGRTVDELGTEIARQYSLTMRNPQVTVAVVNSAADQLKRIGGNFQVGLDGQLVVPDLGAFPAVGYTADRLAARIAAAASARFRNPVRVSASIGQLTGREIDPRLDPNGRSYFRGPAKVSPDGNIYLQPGGLLPVAGLSLAEVRRDVMALEQPLYANPVDVNVALVDSPSMSVFVGGEVRQPGRYPYTTPLTMLQLITMSGWVTENGDMTRVLLLHPTLPAHYNVYRSNVREVLDHGAIGQDLAVGPRDIVVVPMSYIGLIDQVIDQYIRKIIPFNAAATYSYISNPVGSNIVGNQATTTRSTQ